MERNIPGLLLLQLVFFVLPGPPCVVTSHLKISKVVHVSLPKTWFAARSYCRETYTDLVTIRSEQDDIKLAMYEGWIGLRIGSDGVQSWSSEDANTRLSIWNFELCVLRYNLIWESQKCSHLHPFLCMDERLILVQEMKTWEEALQHCRELNDVESTEEDNTLVYDLASLPEANNILLFGETTQLTATTNEVWVGLRFLAGEWLWVSSEEVISSYLPNCPAQQQHCGALVHNSMQWKIMDCSEKRTFLCSIKP
ncbi:uncharacterized protein LOC121184593 isoform X2 [Toxotes jaculatrix]|uniref:uncharacterized protein LOC121184593 isoform X2 n=1 Tax=Toxotes jaculatrix TaxID=941984 RepID=UPI001B3ACD47|nr:uncharacterized protein LOC121184593 isoform X2 [Toxotes jaculatrix]